jgi:hypothetical protein
VGQAVPTCWQHLHHGMKWEVAAGSCTWQSGSRGGTATWSVSTVRLSNTSGVRVAAGAACQAWSVQPGAAEHVPRQHWGRPGTPADLPATARGPR